MSHDCIEEYQNIEDPISLKSKKADVAFRETSKKRPLSNKGTPRAWVLKGALRGRDDMIGSVRATTKSQKMKRLYF